VSVTCHSIQLERADAWTIPVSDKLIAFIAPSSLSTQSVVSGRHLSRGKSWHISWRFNGQILPKYPKFLEILWKLSMHKQCVPGSFLHPPRNKAR